MQRVSLRQSFHAAQSQQRTVGPPSMERFSVTKIVQYRTVVHSRWLETPVSILCSRIIQRHVQRITSSANLSRGPEPTEDCWATVNGTLQGNQKSPSTGQSSIQGGSRLLSRFSAAKSFSVTCIASPLLQSFHAARSQQRTVGPPSMERFSVTKNRPVPNSRPFTVARDSCLDSVQPNRSASRAAW